MIDVLNFSGPYAVGKDTVINCLLDRFSSRLHRVTTLTTRPVSPAVDPSYTSLGDEEFDARTTRGRYLVNEQVGGAVRYATSLDEIDQATREGRLCILNVYAGPQGAGQLRSSLGNRLFSIGLIPPGDSEHERLEVLRARLIGRGRDSHETIEARLGRQASILRYIENQAMLTGSSKLPVFDKVVVSGDLNALVDEMTELVQGFLYERDTK